MSRVGNKPIEIPKGVTATLAGGLWKVKGPKGEISVPLPPGTEAKVDGAVVRLTRKGNLPTERAMHGLARQLIANAVTGVSVGFTRKLEVKGVGFRIEMKGKDLALEMGFSHPVSFSPPPGVTIAIEDKTNIIVSGADKQKVGQVAAELRGIKPPDPYKAKGIKYQEEVIRRKVGKVGA